MPDFTPKEFNELRNNNPYMEIMIPLVQAYGFTNKIQANPHETWYAASLLRLRTNTWGGNMPVPGANYINDGGGGGGVSKEKCCRLGICSCSSNARQGAQSDGSGAASPVTARTETLLQQLNDLRMAQPNGWADWITALDYFNLNVLVIDYFTFSYKDGKYADFYREGAGIFDHPDKNTKGLLLALGDTNGSGTPATAGESVLSILPGIDSTFENKYFEIYTSAGEILVPWINLQSGGGVQPVVVPPPGIGVQYFEVILPDPGGIPQAVYAQNLADALTVAPGITATKTGVANATVVTDLVGSRPATDYTNWDDVGKTLGVFVDGADPVAGGTETFELEFKYADTSLADKFIMFYEANGNSHVIYFDLDASGTFVLPVGLVPTSSTPIPITTGMSAGEIQAATKAVLDTFVFITTSIIGTALLSEYVVAEDVQDADGGTSIIGINYTYNSEIKASDGTVLASDVDSDAKYAEYWNTLKVAYEAGLGNTYPYLGRGIITTGGTAVYGVGDATGLGCSCMNLSGRKAQFDFGAGTGNSWRCVSCIFGAYHGASFTVYAFAPPSPTTPYNTPGNIFTVADSSRLANLTPINELL